MNVFDTIPAEGESSGNVFDSIPAHGNVFDSISPDAGAQKSQPFELMDMDRFNALQSPIALQAAFKRAEHQAFKDSGLTIDQWLQQKAAEKAQRDQDEIGQLESPAGTALATIMQNATKAVPMGGKALLAGMSDLAETGTGNPTTESLSQFADNPNKPLPVEEGAAEMHGLSSIPTKASIGAIKAVPAIGAGVALGAAGAPSAVAAAAPFTFNEKGEVDPVGMATMAVLPTIGKLGELGVQKFLDSGIGNDAAVKLAESVTKATGKYVAPETVAKWLRAGGNQVAANSALMATQAPEVLKSPDKGQAFLDAVAGNIGPALLGFVGHESTPETSYVDQQARQNLSIRNAPAEATERGIPRTPVATRPNIFDGIPEQPSTESEPNEQVQPTQEQTGQGAAGNEPGGAGGVYREPEVREEGNGAQGGSGAAQEVKPFASLGDAIGAKLDEIKDMLNPGGAVSDLSPELQAKSKAANSPEAWGDFGGLNPKAKPTQPELISMGGQAPGDVKEVPKSHLAQLNDAAESFARDPKANVAKAFDLGKSISEAKDTAQSVVDGLRVAGKYIQKKLEGKPVFDDFKRAVGDRHLSLSESAINARKFAKEMQERFPDPTTQEAISNWVDAGGDESKLRQGLAETKPRYRAGYERALKLSPEEKTFAQNIQNYFESRLQDAQKAGILEQGVEDYIHRMFERDTPWKRGAIAELRSGVFTGQPTLAKQRVFNYDFEAEKAGLKPVKSFIKRIAAYDLSLNKAMADRALVKSLMEVKMPDGRPMIDVGGLGREIKNSAGDTEATLIQPKFKPGDENSPAKNRNDFAYFDHPALRKWRWVAKDANDKPIFVQGDVLVHPEATSKVRALFERSAIRANPVGRLALNLGSTVKQTMLDLSGFHPVQIAVHGAEHRTFAPVKEIDFTNPDVRGLIRGGLVVGETTGRELFDEGLAGSSLTKFIPKVGPAAQAMKEWLFQSYIPRLKVATGLHALERNRAAFPKLSEDEVYHLTANQMNAAFGELNYAMLGRSATQQDALRLAMLAPDFFEARSRFAWQAITKYGGRPHLNSGKLVIGEQGKALMYGAAALYLTARVMNKILDDQYHFEPKNAFNVVYNGKAYSLRTVQGDLVHAASDFQGFLRNRLNPIWGHAAMEFVTGRDNFGRTRTLGQQAEDAAKNVIPISLKGLFSGREQNLYESLLNSFGITEHRESAMQEMHEKAQAWKDKNHIVSEPGEFVYDPDKDPYRQIRMAATYGDDSAVREEIANAVKSGIPKDKILRHFQASARSTFTGSGANEQAFKKSLSADELKTYQQAVAEKSRINEIVQRVGQ